MNVVHVPMRATKRRLFVTFAVQVDVTDTRPLSGIVAGAMEAFLREPDIAAGQSRNMPTLYDIDGVRVIVEQTHTNRYFDADGNEVQLP